ncbi:MAG: hypothetical protein K2J11_04615 [Oscillospiraceae bacterium]|nr:hypothetical protein [Oscillospiraceae bacterium]
MNNFTDELDKLNRDLKGLGNLLHDLSCKADSGWVINGEELMFLAEIAYHSAKNVEDIVQNGNSDDFHTDTSLEKWCDELLAIFKRMDWFGRSEVLLYADKVEKKRLNEA